MPGDKKRRTPYQWPMLALAALSGGADRKAVAAVYELAQLLSSITEIKKNMEEANLKIEFVKRKMQERESKKTE